MKTNYPSDLTPQQWDGSKGLIPPAKPGGRTRSLEMHAVVSGILYVVVGRIQWRMLPKEYPMATTMLPNASNAMPKTGQRFRLLPTTPD